MENRKAQGTPQARRLRARRDGAAAASPMGDRIDEDEADSPGAPAGPTGPSRGRLDLHSEGAAANDTFGVLSAGDVQRGCGCLIHGYRESIPRYPWLMNDPLSLLSLQRGLRNCALGL